MPLNESKGNMYDFVTHTFNTVKGTCEHDCTYCYMKRWGRLKPPRLDEREFKTDLGSGNFIFVGSSNDLFAAGNPVEWVHRTLDHCEGFDNRYLFQSKNPAHILDFMYHPVFGKAVVCTTLESDIHYPEIMASAPTPIQRAAAMENISSWLPTYVTIEPLLRFNLDEFVRLIKLCNPQQVNIGADSGHNNLPEPTANEVRELITALEGFTVVNRKTNLGRIIK